MGQWKNIVLIGMPSCGKTTIGRLLAKKLHMTFVDMDQEIEAEEETTISHIFQTQGEEAFRQLETKKAQELREQTGLVIATGGGVIMRKENMNALKETGIICFLDRPLEQLLAEVPDTKRPLLTQNREATIKKLYAQRISLYEAYGDIRIVNDSTAEAAVENVLCSIKKIGGDIP